MATAARQSGDYRAGDRGAVPALVVGATIWGLIWYPYRVLENAGYSGIAATTLTYAVALLLGLLIFRRQLRAARVDVWLIAIALSAALCNLGYVLAMLAGEVMRVLLLFYLAPLWTLVLARLLLAERISVAGLVVVSLALAGAAVMLWRPGTGLPWPRSAAEWLGLGSGFFFALSNVLIRRADHYGIELKSMAVFAGVVALGLVGMAMLPSGLPAEAGPLGAGWIVLIGIVLLAVNLTVQYGLTRVAAGRAVVIFLLELAVAALASWLLAGERMGWREWGGGALIVAASLLSARLEPPAEDQRGSASR